MITTDGRPVLPMLKEKIYAKLNRTWDENAINSINALNNSTALAGLNINSNANVNTNARSMSDKFLDAMFANLNEKRIPSPPFTIFMYSTTQQKGTQILTTGLNARGIKDALRIPCQEQKEISAAKLDLQDQFTRRASAKELSAVLVRPMKSKQPS
ncbi:hypothetical protein ACEPPN_015424 [Leptodophora sp. 'Broadleaf-Isolate-01']